MMADEIEMIQVTMPDGKVRETDLAAVEFVKQYENTAGTLLAPWGLITKLEPAREYLKQQAGKQ
jgi:hypothetical protein